MCSAKRPILSFPLFTDFFHHNLCLRSFPFAFYHLPCLFLALFTLHRSFPLVHPLRLLDFFIFLFFYSSFPFNVPPLLFPNSNLSSLSISLGCHANFSFCLHLKPSLCTLPLPFGGSSSSHYHSNLHSLISIFRLVFLSFFCQITLFFMHPFDHLS